MTIDSADDSKILNRAINTNRISNRTYDSKSNRITQLRRSLIIVVCCCTYCRRDPGNMSRHQHSELSCQSLGSYSTDCQLCSQHDQPASRRQGYNNTFLIDTTWQQWKLDVSNSCDILLVLPTDVYVMDVSQSMVWTQQKFYLKVFYN